MRIEGNKVYLERGETVETALRVILDENIFPQGHVDIRKVSKDFLREMKCKVKWKFNDSVKEYIKKNLGMEFYKEMIGNE